VNRRHFITLLGGAAAAWPLAVRAQQAQKVARIGFLGSTFASPWKSRVEAFQSGLHDLGYVEEKTSPSSSAGLRRSTISSLFWRLS
jgi:putative ABC transport system substrate-binding protein